MSKLTKDVGDYCLSHVVDNELVVIPESHDTGFDEYLAMKIDGVYKNLSTRKRREDCHLEISYPRLGSSSMEFAAFYETPMRFAKDRRFQGLLSVDVTPYMTKFNASEFDSLLLYLKEDISDATVLFVVSTDSFDRAKGIAEKLKSEMGTVTTYLSLPSKEQMLSYLNEKVKDFKLFEKRREEIERAIEGVGFEVVSGIRKALKTKTSVPESKGKREKSITFGY